MKKWVLLLALLCAACSQSDAGFLMTSQSGGACAGGSDGIAGCTAYVSWDTDNGNASTPTLSWSEFTPSSDGTITYGHYVLRKNETGHSRIVLMDASGNVLDHSAQQEPIGEYRVDLHVEMEHDYCLVTGTTYLIGVWAEADDQSGPCPCGDAFHGHYHSDTGAGYGWSDTSFDVSSPSGGDVNYSLSQSVNNSATTR